jgi:nicotinate dehydrogenase subunit A
VQADPATPLVYVLRNDLGLKGVRFGCGTGHCGSCTVVMDGRAIQSCDTPLWSAVGKQITTVEGLGEGHPLREAFLEEQAAQCGYCINGILMSISTLKDPTEEQILKALDRHLCRCGTHVRILKAIKRATSQP